MAEDREMIRREGEHGWRAMAPERASDLISLLRLPQLVLVLYFF